MAGAACRTVTKFITRSIRVCENSAKIYLPGQRSSHLGNSLFQARRKMTSALFPQFRDDARRHLKGSSMTDSVWHGQFFRLIVPALKII